MLTRYTILERRLVETTDPRAIISVYVSPDDKERRELAETYAVSEHFVASALDPDERSRLSTFGKQLAIIIKRPQSYTAADNLSFRVLSAGAVLAHDRLVIILPDDVTLFDSAEQLKHFSVATLLAHVLTRFVTHFREHLKVISLIVDDLEERLLQIRDRKSLASTCAVAKSLDRYQAFLESNDRTLAALLAEPACLGFSVEERRLFDEVAIENRQCYAQAELCASLLARLLKIRAITASDAALVRLHSLGRALLALLAPTMVFAGFAVLAPGLATASPWGASGVLGVAALASSLVLALWPRHP